MSEARSGELSTLSTPPTGRTLVEASGGVTTPREPTEEKTRGESEGGEREKPPDAVAPAWARALSSRTSCALGRCGYADPAKPPNRHLAAIGCDGYHATEHVDADGRATVRWYLCPRHRAWWKLERMRRAAGKP